MSLDEEVEAARRAASSAVLFGLLSTVMSLLGLCSSCTTLLFALPLAIGAIWQARRALEQEDELAHAQANTAMALGVINTVYSGTLLLLMLLYVLMYVGIVAMAFGMAAVGNANN